MFPPPARLRAGALVLPTPPQGGSDAYETVCVKTLRESRTARKTTRWHGKYPPFPRRACPWLEQGRESSANRARNAHIRGIAAGGGGASLWPPAASSLRPEGARSARVIRWIPACAGMARWGHGSGGVGFIRWMPIGFLHRLLRRNDGVKGRNGGDGNLFLPIA